MVPELDLNKTKLCACGNLRRTMRALTQFYDDLLKPCGLRVTQLTLLIVIARYGPVTINQLASYLGMDRTTLSRSLTPLRQQGIIVTVSGDDQRTRTVTLTSKGRTALAKALPLWEEAQSHVINGLGAERFDAWLQDLSAIESLAG